MDLWGRKSGTLMYLWHTVWLGWGCTDFTLNPIDPVELPPKNVIVRESFVQAPLPKVDLLLVIDNTASMAQEQVALAENFARLLDSLDASAIGWQLGVVTTDMNASSAGWLYGSPWILTPDLPSRDEIFAEMFQVGVEGDGPEAGLAAALSALELSSPGGPNAGFRRDDALLHILFFSDADDQSEAWLGPDPVGTFLARLVDEVSRTALPAYASALVGPVPTGCSSPSGTAVPALRYDQVATSSGGVVVSICAPDFEPVIDTLSEISIVWRAAFELREDPVEGSLHVELDGEVTDAWSLADKVLTFEEPPAPESRIDVRYLTRLGGI